MSHLLFVQAVSGTMDLSHTALTCVPQQFIHSLNTCLCERRNQRRRTSSIISNKCRESVLPMPQVAPGGLSQAKLQIKSSAK